MRLEHGADVNSRGRRVSNALQAASINSYENLVQILLDHGADVNARGGFYGNARQAASYKRYDSVDAVEHGADVNAQGGDYGNALCAASTGGHDKFVQILLKHGADQSARYRSPFENWENHDAREVQSYRNLIIP
ncbi:hypothetical protein F1880_002608 [Penicillium rolfsii]|nr:hypothetical protein F1880_002608 [Penicillium rolfsii]